MTIRHCFSILMITCLLPLSSMAKQKVIYGEDNRVESQEFSDQRFVDASASVAGMVWNKNLFQSKTNEDEYDFRQLPLRLYYNVCKEEPFSEQITLPTCTAFLVGPDLLLTAGHCIKSALQCKQNKWIFDYVKDTKSIKKENTYSCEKLINRKLISSSGVVKDFALVQLDRRVEGRTPLLTRQSGKIKRKTPLVVIGHPVGLPMKIADGAQASGFRLSNLLHPIRAYKKSKNYFITNTDTYMGNSGSPVFNETTGRVEGILIQGKKDFSYTEDGCLSSIVNEDRTSVFEEKVFKILKVDGLKEEVRKSYQRTFR